jgi:hypothetical protein
LHLGKYRIEYFEILDAANINHEMMRLFVCHDEMLFLSQDHGAVCKFGVRARFFC